MVGVVVAVAGSVLRVVFVESVASAPTVGSAEYVAPSESSDTGFFGDSASQKTSAESVALSVLVAAVDLVVFIALVGSVNSFEPSEPSSAASAEPSAPAPLVFAFAVVFESAKTVELSPSDKFTCGGKVLPFFEKSVVFSALVEPAVPASPAASVDFVVLVASAEPAELPKMPDLSASAVLVETLSAKASRLFM